MTRVIAQNGDDWHRETVAIQRQLEKIHAKIETYEKRYGKLSEALYGRVDDMELLEWEAEIETMRRLAEKLESLK